MTAQHNQSIFGDSFKLVLVLTFLAWITYTLPSVRAVLTEANFGDFSVEVAAASASVNTNASTPLVCPAGYFCTNPIPPTVPSSCYEFSNNLFYGAGTGEAESLTNDVQQLQIFLQKQGYSILSSEQKGGAVFGPSTLIAVIAFQRKQGLPVSGYVGPLTRGKIAALCTQTVSIDNVQIYLAGGISPLPVTTIQEGQKYDIRWTESNTKNLVFVSLYKLEGTQWVKQIAIATSSAVGKGQSSVGWNVRDIKITNAKYKIYVETIGAGGQVDVSILPSVSPLVLRFGTDSAMPGEKVALFVSGFPKDRSYSYYVSFNNPRTDTSVPATISADGTYLGFTVPTLPAGTYQVSAGAYSAFSSTNYLPFAIASSTQSSSATISLDSASPATGLVQLSTTAQTSNVVLGVFDVKSSRAPSTLRELKLIVKAKGPATASVLFNRIKLSATGLTYAASTILPNPSVGTDSSFVATFTNMTIPLAVDTTVPVRILGDVAIDTNNQLDNTSAHVVINAQGTAGGTSNNPVIEDAKFNTVAIVQTGLASNDLTFVSATAPISISDPVTTYNGAITNAVTGSTTQQFTFKFSVTAGSNPIYLSNNVSNAVGIQVSASLGINVVDFSSNANGGDGSTYFYIAPGQTRSFSATYVASGLMTVGGIVQVNSINYGLLASSPNSSFVSSSSVSNSLKAVLFH